MYYNDTTTLCKPIDATSITHLYVFCYSCRPLHTWMDAKHVRPAGGNGAVRSNVGRRDCLPSSLQLPVHPLHQQPMRIQAARPPTALQAAARCPQRVAAQMFPPCMWLGLGVWQMQAASCAQTTTYRIVAATPESQCHVCSRTRLPRSHPIEGVHTHKETAPPSHGSPVGALIACPALRAIAMVSPHPLRHGRQRQQIHCENTL
jgi:hypothetical protein